MLLIVFKRKLKREKTNNMNIKISKMFDPFHSTRFHCFFVRSLHFVLILGVVGSMDTGGIRACSVSVVQAASRNKQFFVHWFSSKTFFFSLKFLFLFAVDNARVIYSLLISNVHDDNENSGIAIVCSRFLACSQRHRTNKIDYIELSTEMQPRTTNTRMNTKKKKNESLSLHSQFVATTTTSRWRQLNETLL